MPASQAYLGALGQAMGGSRGGRAFVALLTAFAVIVGQQQPAAADDPLQQALQRKQDLERAVANSRANAERYQSAAAGYQAAMNEAYARIGELADQERQAQTAADALAAEIAIREEQLALAAFQLDQTKALADSLNAEAAAETQQLRAREDLYAKHLRLSYEQAQISPLEMLLSSRTLTEFADQVQALITIDREDKQLATEITALRADTQSKLDDAGAKQREIAGIEQQISTQRATLATQKSEYDQLVAQTRQQESAQAQLAAVASQNRDAQAQNAAAAQAETASLGTQLQEAEALYEQLAAEAAARSGLGAWSGRFAYWPVNGVITQYFGPTSFTGEPPAWWGGVYYPHFHNGIDIAAPMYTPIRAPAAGQVTTVGKPYAYSGDYAEIVIIAHGGNFSTLYGHLDDSVRPPTVHVGQWVLAGQVIGYVGMTGHTTGPHLHFMTILNGHMTDPMPYLP